MKASEDRIQAECYQWFHNSYPHLRGLLCYNFGNSKNRIDGARNKAMGLQKGRTDMELNYQGITYFFEFKIPGGRQSPAQKEWEKLIRSQGFEYYLIDNREYFERVIKMILNQ